MAITETNDNNVVQGEFEKAIGFLNISVKATDGRTIQLGGLAMKASEANQARLVEMLRSEQISLEQLTSKLVLNFHDSEVVQEAWTL